MNLNECLAEDSGCSSFKHGGCEPDESYKIKELYLDLDDCNVRYREKGGRNCSAVVWKGGESGNIDGDDCEGEG